MHRIIMLCGMMAFCIAIQAQCPPVSPLPTPYYENFDTLPAGETGSFANCWTATTTSAPNWKSEIGQTSSSSTGPSTDYSGSMAYVYLETTGGGLGDTSGFISPLINLTGLTNPELNFYYHMYGADMGILQVLIWNGTTWTTEWTRTGEQHTSLSDPWSKGVVSLASYSGNIRIKFLGTRGADYTGDMAIDEISVGEAPACPQPTNIVVSNFTPTTADVNWNAVTPAINGYEIIYGTMGFDPALTGTSVSAVANSNTLSGLSSATDYDLYIISDCGATDGISDTTGPIPFTTLCGTYTAPYFNDFESDDLDVPPLCWVEYATYSSAWVEVEDYSGTSAPYNGGQALYMYSGYSDTGGGDTLLAITPQFTDLPVGDKQVRFVVNADDAVDKLIVGTMASALGTSIFHAIDTIEFTTPDTYREVIVELTTANGYNGTDEYIALAHNLGATYDYIRIDDFNYEVIPDCPKVLNTVLDTVTDISAAFSFESTGTTFNYEWGPAGYTFGQGTATTGTATSNPFTVNGFQPNTAYDIYIQNDCSGSGNGSSLWDGPFTFITECAAVTAPYANNFDLDGLDEAPDCWDYYETYSSAYVEVEDYNTAYSGNQTLLLYNSYGDMPDDTLLAISPKFGDITAGDKQISFYSQVSDAGVSLIVGTMPSPVATSSLHPLDTFSYKQIDTYEKFVVYLNTANGYNGTDKFVYFMHGGEITYEYIDIDDFAYDFAPACIPPLPNSLGVTSVTYSAADIIWGASAGSKTYINWGATGFIPGFTNGAGIDSVAGNIDSYTITGLNGQTTYEFYVRDSCAVDGLSPWVGPFSFTTQCAPLMAPFNEDFSAGSIPACWANYSADTDPGVLWEFSGSVGYATGNLRADGTFAWVDDSSPDAADVTLKTPYVDVSTLTKPYLYFEYFSNNTNTPGDNVTLHINFFDGAQWHNDILIYSGDDANWQEKGVPLDSYTITGPVQVEFVIDNSTSSSNYNDVLLDNVGIIEAPSCPEPFNLSALGIVDTAATLTWDGNLTATTYEVWFGPQGFYQGTQTLPSFGTKVLTTNDSLFVDTLAPSTCYEFAVRSVCAPGDTSEWIGAFSFCTPCSPFMAPYFQNFDATTEPDIDGCWTVVNATSSSSSRIETYDGSSPSAVSMANSVEIYNSGASSGDLILVSPMFADLDATKRIRFEVFDESNGSDLIIGTLTNPNDPATFTPIKTITEAEMADDVWQNVIVSFASYTGSDKFIGIKHGLNGTYDYIYIDDFQYEVIPSCIAPTSLLVDAIGADTAAISWTSGGSVAGLDFQVEYGTAAFGSTGNSRIIVTNADSTVLTGLMEGTNHCYWVRQICVAGDTSAWSGPVCFYTNCYGKTAPYFQDFDAAVDPDIDVCWTVLNKTSSTSSRIESYDGTSPTAFSLQNSIEIYNSGGSSGKLILVSPQFIDFDATKRIRFKVYDESNTSDLIIGTLSDPLDTTTFTPFDTILETDMIDDAWQGMIVSFASYTGTDKYIGIAHGLNSTYDYIYLDDFHYEVTPTCLEATNPIVDSVTGNSAFLRWTSGGSVASLDFEIEYGTNVLGSSTNTRIVVSNADSAVLNGLTDGTNYCYWVRQICAVGDTSFWSASACFVTECMAKTAPYSQNFDQSIEPDINVCWSVINNTSSSYSSIETYDGTGPAAFSPVNSIEMYNSSGSSGDLILVSPQFTDLDATKRITFQVYDEDGGSDLIIGTLTDPANAATFTAFDTITEAEMVDDVWQKMIVPFAAYTGSDQYIGFKHGLNSSYNDIYLDDFRYEVIPSCLEPIALAVDSTTVDSAYIRWTAGGSATSMNFEVEYGTAPLGSALNTRFVVSGADSAIVNALTGGTGYCFYVREICGIGDTSFWSGPECFYTDCPAIIVAPYIASFEGITIGDGPNYENCWSTSGASGLAWESEDATGSNENSTGTGPFYDASFPATVGGTYMYLETSSGGYGDSTELYSPYINTSTLGAAELRYYYHMYGVTTNKLEVYAEDQTTGNRTFLDSIVGQQHAAGSDLFSLRVISLDSVPTNNIKIVFVGYRGNDYTGDIAIDEVSVVGVAVSCPAPTSLTASNMGCDSVKLSWTSLNTGSYSILEYGPAGFVPGTGAGTIASFVQSPYVISGLTPGTAYDFYVADTCSSDTSAFAGPVSFTTATGPLPVASFVATANGFIVNVDGTASTGANSYSWDFGDGNTATGVSATNIYANGGSQSIVLTVSNACGTDDTTITLANVSLEENPLSRSLKVYPNPSNDVVNISFVSADAKTAVIRLLDISGREILSIEKTNLNGKLNETIDIRQLADGVYMLSISDGNNTVNRRLIKN